MKSKITLFGNFESIDRLHETYAAFALAQYKK